MDFNSRYLIVFIVVVSIFTGCIDGVWTDGETTHTVTGYNHINFLGDVTGGDSLTINGEIVQETMNEDRPRFENVTLRLYTEEGDLLASKCYGRITKGESTNVSYSHPEVPKYVVFTSSDFWNADKVVGASTMDYFVYENGDYRPEFATGPSDYPVDVTRHSPCR